MIKQSVLAACTALALISLAAAQSTSGTTGPASSGSSANGVDGQGGSHPTQTVPGWGGTQAPKSGAGVPASGQVGTTTQGGQATQDGVQPGAAGAGGLMTINPTAVLVTYYAVQPADTLASKLMKTSVYNGEGQKVGAVEDLLIDQGRNIGGVVIGVGGFLGLGERYISLPPSSIVLTPQPNGSYRAVINATKESLRDAPEFKFQGNQSR